MNLHIDIETYSSVDLKSSGAYKYCESPDFKIMLLAYAFDYEPVQIVDFTSGDLLPSRVITALNTSFVMKYAHNAAFERTALRKIGFDIPPSQWTCSAIKAGYCGLPLGLSDVSKALKLEEENKAKLASGRALIKLFCIPKKDGTRNSPSNNPLLWEDFKEYCIQDVEAERAVIHKLVNYSVPKAEKELYDLDQKINDTGIQIDLVMANNAVSINDKYSESIASQIKDLTGVNNPNSAAQIKAWLSKALEKDIKSLSKEAMPMLLEETEDRTVLEVIKLRNKSSKTSIKKYVAMQNCICTDYRAHGLFQFYGASRTGRWAGRLIQMQNLPQNHLDDLDTPRNAVLRDDYELLTLLYDDVSSVLSQLIRTAFVAPEHYTFAVSDFSAIEARVLAWLAGETWRIDVFKSHGKIYEASASMMFSVPIEQVTKGSSLRQKGKVAELALGYQGGPNALKKMGGASMGLSDTEMKLIVNKWRKANPAIAAFWQDVQSAAIRAVASVDVIEIDYLKFEYDKNYLTIELPSGRKLYYFKPAIKADKFGNPSIQFKGMNQVTKQWQTTDAYGGKFVENIVQAVARDLLADAMIKLDKAGFKIVMHVHDEVVCEIPELELDQLDEMNTIMSTPPSWALGLPLAADGYTTKYYKKE